MIRILFFGTPDFSATILKALIAHPSITVACVITQPDKPAGRGKKLSLSPVKALALDHGIPVLQPQKIKPNVDSFIQELLEFLPIDIGVVVAFGQILPKAVLDFPKHGCINIHASLLPRWRGAAPIHRAIMSGDSTTGVCLMKMDEGLDTGPVYCASTLSITQNDSTGTIHDKLAQMGATLVGDSLEKIVAGSLQPLPQIAEGITYAQKITNEEAHIDWNSPADKVHNFIRGLSPFPGAFCFVEGQRLKIFASEPLPEFHSSHICPGTINRLTPHEVRVQCQTGSVRLLTVQLEGRKKLDIEEFTKNGTLTEGMVLK